MSSPHSFPSSQSGRDRHPPRPPRPPKAYLGGFLWSLLAGVLPKSYRGPIGIRRLSVPAPANAAFLAGLRIGVVSDIHLSRSVPEAHILKAVGLLNGLSLDVLLLLGDYVSGEDPQHFLVEDSLELFSSVPARLGIFAVPGNHDLTADGPDPLRSAGRMGIHDVTNRGVRVSYGGSAFRIVGVDDLTRGKPDLERAFAGSDEPALFMTHHPDVVMDPAFPSERVWLTAAGHLHGGQVRLPFLGAPWRPTSYPALFDHGLTRVGEVPTYISSGVGTSGLPIRVAAPSEVVLIRVTEPKTP